MNQSKIIKKKVVVMGGGNGSAISLNAMKKLTYRYDLSAVISMSDSGHSSGAIRRHFNTLPPGDILRAILALSPYDFQVLKKIFYKNRVQNLKKINTDLKASRGPNLGNLFLALVGQYEGDFVQAVRGLEEILETVGHTYPASLKQSDLAVQLSNGDVVRGETHIDEPTYDRALKIKKIWLEPEVSAYGEATSEIRQASGIIFGPGDLYTSVIASLLPKGIYDAIEDSTAKLVYVVGNAYHSKGETGPEKLSGFVSQLEEYLPRKLDYIVYNNAKLTSHQLATYKQRGWDLIEMDITSRDDQRIITDNYERREGGLCPDKLSKIFQIISDKHN